MDDSNMRYCFVFDWVVISFALCWSLYRNLKSMAPKNSSAKLLKLGDFDTDKRFHGIIEDPYYVSICVHRIVNICLWKIHRYYFAGS